MERELLLTGIGGQGVQLAAQVLARGATLDGRHVMLFGVYAGAMRGMNTDATVVIGDGPLQSPPLISHTWSAIGMHDRCRRPCSRATQFHKFPNRLRRRRLSRLPWHLFLRNQSQPTAALATTRFSAC